MSFEVQRCGNGLDNEVFVSLTITETHISVTIILYLSHKFSGVTVDNDHIYSISD
jgi:hypothetical protein